MMPPDGRHAATADERREERMRQWAAAPGVEFVSARAREGYAERVGLLRDAIAMKKPARVPIAPWMGLFPIRYAGYTARDAFYDREKLAEASRRYHEDFQPDTLSDSFTMVPGDVFEILDYRMFKWPGHGVGGDAGYQYEEAEYMRDDEYDLVVRDFTGFLQRRFLPRAFGALRPLGELPVPVDLLEMGFAAPYLAAFGEPEMKEMLHRLMAAGDAAGRWLEEVVTIDAEMTATFGMPGFGGGATKAPYDILADTLRGTRGIVLDRFRRPHDILTALERLVPVAIEWGASAADESDNPLIFIPLHKGADGFMSDADFRQFYWPSLRAVINGLVAEGLVPLLFVEGSYNERLDVIVDSEIAPGSTVWMFDQTDMTAVRRHLDGFACFGGNVPGSLLKTGTPEDVEAYVKRLLNEAAGGGGFILSTGIVVDDARPENLRTMMEAGHRYGAEA
jgi:hypothetical protein